MLVVDEEVMIGWLVENGNKTHPSPQRPFFSKPRLS